MSEESGSMDKMCSQSPLTKAMGEAYSCFSKAEHAIEIYESVSLKNQLAALNELRYAGHHLLNAVKTEVEKDNPFCTYNDDLYCVAKHSARALNDVLDSTVLVSLECIRRFLDRQYTEKELQESKYFNYPDDYREILNTRQLLEDAGMVKGIEEDSREDVCLKRFRLMRLKMEKTMAELDSIRSMHDAERKRNQLLQRQQIEVVEINRGRREAKVKKRRDWLAFVLSILAFAQAFWGCSVLHDKFVTLIDSLREANESSGRQTSTLSFEIPKENTNG